jgi:hypothetical protein
LEGFVGRDGGNDQAAAVARLLVVAAAAEDSSARLRLPQQAETVGKVRETVGKVNYQQPTVGNGLLGVLCRA